MSQRIVLDASAALHVVTRTQYALPVISKLKAANIVIAPRLFCSEAANALWKYVKFGDLAKEHAVTKLEEALSLIDSFEQDDELVVEALAGAIASGHPVYDFTYLVLARRFVATLVTMDKKMAEVANNAGIDTFYGGEK